MTSKIVVNNIEADAGVSTVTFNSNVERGTSNLHSVGVEVAGINVLGADTPIGTGSTIYDDGGARFSGIVTATSFSGSGSNLTGLVSLANGADNRVITASSASALNGEANLNFNGSQLLIGTTTAAAFSSRKLTISDVTSGGTTAVEIRSATNGTGRIYFTDSTSSGNAGSYAGKVFYDHNDDHMALYTGGSTSTPSEKLKVRANGYVDIAGASDVRLTLGSQGTAGSNDSNWIRGNGANLMYNCATTSGDHIWEIGGTAYAKINDEFGMKADNTCKTWLVYRSEAGNEGIIDDFNVASVNDEGTGTFWVNLDRNIHRHGNGFSQSIVFGCYNDGSRQLIAGIGYAPSHGSYNPWWDVEDNGCRVNTQRSTDGVKVDAKVFSLAMFGDTGDLSPT